MSNAGTLVDALARAGITTPISRDHDHPDRVFRLNRASGDGGTVVMDLRGRLTWTYAVYRSAADVEPVAHGHSDDLDSLARKVRPWIESTIPDALSGMLDENGRTAGRLLDDVIADYLDRFGPEEPHTLDQGAVWALLLVGPGDDPAMVALPPLPAIGRGVAPLMRVCECGALLEPDAGDDGRISCETCGSYYDDEGRPLAHPEELRS